MMSSCCPIGREFFCKWYDKDRCCNWGYEKCPIYEFISDVVDFINRFDDLDETVKLLRKIYAENLQKLMKE